MKCLFILGLLLISISANAAFLPSTEKVEEIAPGQEIVKISFTVEEKSNVTLSFSGTEVRNPSSEYYYRFRYFYDWNLTSKTGADITSGGWVTNESYPGGRDCSTEEDCEVHVMRSTRELELETGTYELAFGLETIEQYNQLHMNFDGVRYTISPSTFPSTINLNSTPDSYGNKTYTVSFTLNERKEVELTFWGTIIIDSDLKYSTYAKFSDWSVHQNGETARQGGWSVDERFYLPPKWNKLSDDPWTAGKDCSSLHCEITRIRSSGGIVLDPGTYEVTFDMLNGQYYGLMDFLGVFTKEGSAPSACDITYTLPNNQWRQISLPCNPGTNSSISAVFGDDIKGQYGKDWTLYEFNTQTNSYGEALKLTDPIEQGKGYWIIQVTGEAVTLKMPPDSIKATASYPLQIASVSGSNSIQWTLAGNPFSSTLKLGDFSLKTDSGICSSSPCDLNKAKMERLLHNQVWIYDGDSYTEKGTQDTLNAWDGFWVPSLEKSKGHVLSLVDSVNVECLFFNKKGSLVGDGEYTYDPSVRDSFSYKINSGEEKVFDTYYATEFHPNITLAATDNIGKWTGGDYQLTDVITNIWAGDEPGTLLPEGGGSPFLSVVSGWKMDADYYSGGYDTRAFYMDWSTPSKGSWSGKQINQSNIDSNTGAFEFHNESGDFTCKSSKTNDFEKNDGMN